MAVNPQLLPSGMPVAFDGEHFVLMRDGVEFEVDKIPDTPRGKFSSKGKLYLSNVRLIFVDDKPAGNIFAFDMPLLFIHEESFNQPIFLCNNLSGKVHPVIPDGSNRALFGTHNFKVLFKEGGVGTFVPLFFNLLRTLRDINLSHSSAPSSDPLPTAQPPVDEMIRHAYIDPSDPTRLYLQQPDGSHGQLRRRNYTALSSEGSQL